MPAHLSLYLDAVFEPHSVAVVGASHTTGKVGNDVVKNLVEAGFKGQIYPVNPKPGEIHGKEVFAELSELPHSPELVVIVVPAQVVPEVVHQTGEAGAKAVVIISAGFAETGNKHLQEYVVKLCQQYHLTLIGPNCLGVINPAHKLNASFAPLTPEAGSVAFLSQSGALCSSVLDYAGSMGLGFSKFISIGNKAMVGELELLQYLYRDRQTKVIMMYVEDLDQSAEIIKLAHTVTTGQPHKPIVMLKSGRSQAGAAASASHTGSLAGNDAAYNALSAQSGIIRVDTIAEMFHVADAFSDNRRLLRDKNIAVITNAGGPGVITTDALVEAGLRLATLSGSTQAKLQRYLPPAASITNPIDILGDADAIRYRTALELVLADSAVDGVLIVLTPQTMTEVEGTARAIAQLKQNTYKPIIVSFMGQDLVKTGQDILAEADVTTTEYPESAVSAFKALYEYKQWQQPKKQTHFSFRAMNTSSVTQQLTKLKNQLESSKPSVLDVATSFRVLKTAGLPVVPSIQIANLKEAQAAVHHHQLGSSVAVKILSPDIAHKSDVDGVKLNVARAEIPKAYRQLVRKVRKKAPKARIQGVQVSSMAEDGLDMILGFSTDPRLGKLIMIGWGGIYTEILQDVAWGLAPLKKFDAERMIDQLKAKQILDGARGKPKLDTAALRTLLGQTSYLANHVPEIKELDMNPVRVLPAGQGVKILDARIVI